uniref:CCHC-type domain-containing protein n=1 Tax=Trichuris muris TaxID=70415 RepID=A0A5S6Q663_TRIMR
MVGASQFETFVPEKGATWGLYMERLNFHFEAHGIMDDAKKRALLLSVCGPSTYALIRSVISPKLPNELSYEEITVAMKQYFNPAPSEIVERFRFYKRDQRPNESIADFVAELRRLSEHCNFGNGLDTALRDRLVCGISDESLQRRLLADQVATFDVALREALATETARLQALEIRTGSSQDDVKQVCTTTRKQMPNDNRTCSGQRSLKVDKCYRCGGGHDAQVCRFINQSCRYCQKMGHIERVCRKKIRQRKLDLSQPYQQLKVDEQTAELLTLNTLKGLLQMTRLPFGIDVAPSIFQRFMDTCLAGLDGVKAYLDDVLIMGRSEAEHWERVKAVLERLDKAGIRLKRDKCIFGVDEVEYLGF